jgi:hypothetical protein
MSITSIVTTDFTTKEEYLAWRAAWRIGYAALSDAIRQNKRDMQKFMHPDERAKLQTRKHWNRCDARALLEVRRESKVKVAAQRAEALIKQ